MDKDNSGQVSMQEFIEAIEVKIWFFFKFLTYFSSILDLCQTHQI